MVKTTRRNKTEGCKEVVEFEEETTQQEPRDSETPLSPEKTLASLVREKLIHWELESYP